MSRASKPGYKAWTSSLRGLNQEFTKLTSVFVYGSSSFLQLKTKEKLKRLASAEGYQLESYPADQLDSNSLVELIEQDELFAEKKQIWLTKAQQNIKLLQSDIYSRLSASNQLVIFYESDKPNPKVANALSSHTYKITCYEPYPSEYISCVSDLSKFYQVEIDPQIAAFLIERLGQDLFKLDSELKNLSLIFPNQKPSIEQLTETLGSLREDHGFKIEDFLLKKQFPKALQLIDELIKRGESPLALLGILAAHCRKALHILKPHHTSPKLPDFIAQKYKQALQLSDYTKYQAALRLCQETDILFKTSRVSKVIPLSEIILRLR